MSYKSGIESSERRWLKINSVPGSGRERPVCGKVCTRFGGMHPARGRQRPNSEQVCTRFGGMHPMRGRKRPNRAAQPPSRVQTPEPGAQSPPLRRSQPPSRVQTPEPGAQSPPLRRSEPPSRAPSPATGARSLHGVLSSPRGTVPRPDTAPSGTPRIAGIIMRLVPGRSWFKWSLVRSVQLVHSEVVWRSSAYSRRWSHCVPRLGRPERVGRRCADSRVPASQGRRVPASPGRPQRHPRPPLGRGARGQDLVQLDHVGDRIRSGIPPGTGATPGPCARRPRPRLATSGPRGCRTIRAGSSRSAGAGSPRAGPPAPHAPSARPDGPGAATPRRGRCSD